MAAIAAWNAVYLSQAVEALKKRGEAVPEEYLPILLRLDGSILTSLGNTASLISLPALWTTFVRCGFQNKRSKRRVNSHRHRRLTLPVCKEA
jgi:hypothetical protein